MVNQVGLHNEVILVGRVIGYQKNISCNNKKAIKLKLAIPNDDDYNLEPNFACVYVYDDGNISNSLNKSQAIAISGHLESNHGQRIIANIISLIKEPNNA